MSRSSFIRSFQCLEIEEKILNLGALIAALGVFMPWFGGEWFGEPTVWSGFQFYTSFIGLLVFLANIFVLSLTILPMMGHQIVRASLRDHLRFITGLECVLLVIVAWSVLTNITLDRAQYMEIRFGIYLSLVGGIVVSLYSFLRIQQQKKRSAQDFFQHSDDASPPQSKRIPQPKPPENSQPKPPPPPPGSPEEPRLFA